jgi:hypothetical protein
MELHPLPHTLRVVPPFPVEQKVSVDGKTVTVAIEWPVIASWLGPRANDVNAVREALHERRFEIGRTIQAHLFAHGIPLSSELTLTLDDFRAQPGA